MSARAIYAMRIMVARLPAYEAFEGLAAVWQATNGSAIGARSVSELDEGSTRSRRRCCAKASNIMSTSLQTHFQAPLVSLVIQWPRVDIGTWSLRNLTRHD